LRRPLDRRTQESETVVTLCDAPIIGRDGKPLGFTCNLDKDHLDRCCQTTRDDEPVEAEDGE